MKKMTPREALYNVCVALGPMPKTNRNDNIEHNEVLLRDSIRVLQNFVTYHDDSVRSVPEVQLDWLDADQVLVSPRNDDLVHVKPSSPRSVRGGHVIDTYNGTTGTTGQGTRARQGNGGEQQ